MSAGRRAAAPRSTPLVWTLCVGYAAAGVGMVALRGADVVRGVGVCAVFLAAVAAVEAAVVHGGQRQHDPRRLPGAATLVGLAVAAIVVVGVLAAVVLAPDAGQRLGWALGWSAAALPLLALTRSTRSAHRKGMAR